MLYGPGSTIGSNQDAWSADASDAKKLSMFTDDAATVIDDLAYALAELQIAANDDSPWTEFVGWVGGGPGIGGVVGGGPWAIDQIDDWF